MAKNSKGTGEPAVKEPTDNSPVDSVEEVPGDDFLGTGGALDDLDMGFKLDPEAQAALDYDPFKAGGALAGDPEPEPAAGSPGSPAKGDQAAGGEGDPAVPAAGADPKPEGPLPGDPAPELPAVPGEPAPVVPVVEDPRDEQIRKLTENVQNLTNVVAQQAAPKPADGDAEAQAATRYLREVPDQMMNLINSEDPAERRQGIAALVNGVGQMIHAEVMKDVETRIQTVSTEVQTNASVNNEGKRIFDDFYGAFPALNVDALRPLVVAETQKVYKELGVSEWSDSVRDAIGVRVQNVLKGFSPPAPAAGTGEGGGGGGTSAQSPKPAVLNDGGTRPAPAVGTDSESEIEKVIFG